MELTSGPSVMSFLPLVLKTAGKDDDDDDDDDKTIFFAIMRIIICKHSPGRILKFI